MLTGTLRCYHSESITLQFSGRFQNISTMQSSYTQHVSIKLVKETAEKLYGICCSTLQSGHAAKINRDLIYRHKYLKRSVLF
jgi:hypothetical protein